MYTRIQPRALTLQIDFFQAMHTFINILLYTCLLFGLVWLPIDLRAQSGYFPDRCTGIWTGALLLQANGRTTDSVQVRLTIAVKIPAQEWVWKTEYLSERYPVVKDYTMRLVDAPSNHFVLDEGDGILLREHVFGDKSYTVFETSGQILTSSYELRGDVLIFEVTSGKLQAQSGAVTDHPVLHVQRAVLTRTP